MRIRLLIVLAVVGFASPWYMVAKQVQEATALQAPLKSAGESAGRAQKND